MAINGDFIRGYGAGKAAAVSEKVVETVTEWLEENVDPDSGYVIDKSLTIEGAAADAKATGDEINDLKSAISQYNGTPNLLTGGYITNDGKLHTDGGTNDRYIQFIPVKKGNLVELFAKGGTNTNAISFYTAESESSYVEGVANLQTKHFFYNVTQDGYIRCYFFATDAQLSAISVTIYSNADAYIKQLQALNAKGLDILPFEFRYGEWNNQRYYFTRMTVYCSASELTVAEPLTIYAKENLRCDWDLMENGSVAATYRITSANSPYTIPAGSYYVNVSKTNSEDVSFDDIRFGMTMQTAIKQELGELSARVDALSGETNLEKFKDAYRYIAVSFMNFPYYASNNMVVLGSNDLRTFDVLAKKGIYSCQKTHTDSNGNTGINAFRDPAVIKIGDYYYITYTVISNIGGNAIGICKTKDFDTFTELDNLSITVTGKTYSEIWAPDWFRDGNDIYIVATCVMELSGVKSFETAICKYDAENHTVSAGTVISELQGIDYHIYHTDGKYYAVGGNYRIYAGNTLTGPYTQINNNLVGGCEAPFLVRLDSGKWRLYRQEVNAERGQAYMIYQDADNLESETWASEKYVVWTPEADAYAKEVAGSDDPVGYYYHWTIYDFNRINDNNNNFVS